MVPLEGMACSTESGCVPKISQIVPLDGGNLLAVTCQTLNVSTNKPCNFLILYQITCAGQRLEVQQVCAETFHTPRLSICAVESSVPSCTVGCSHDSMDDMISAEKEGYAAERKPVLLACLASSGEVRLLDCLVTGFKDVSTAQCGSGLIEPCEAEGEGDVEEKEEFTQCVFCGSTSQLVVTARSGRVLSLRVTGREHGGGGGKKTGEQDNDEEEEVMDTFDGSDCAIDWSLDEEDLDHLLSLVQTSSRGVPITCTCPVDWSRISLEQVDRKSPLHVNLPPEQGEGLSAALTLPRGKTNLGRRNSDNSVILQYEAPPVAVLPCRWVGQRSVDHLDKAEK